MRSCKARVITLDDAVEVVRGEHDHAPCPAKNKAQRIVSQMRKRAREEVQTVPTIYRDALQTVNQDGERDAVAAQLLQFVRPAWDGIAQELDEEEGLEGFKTYFHQTWMRGSYQLVLWNYYTYDGPRTNNRLEGWHSRLKRIVKKPHPNIYELIDVFRSEEAATNVTISQLTTGANPPPHKKKYTAIDSRVEKLKDRMHNGQVSINDYIAAIGHIVGL